MNKGIDKSINKGNAILYLMLHVSNSYRRHGRRVTNPPCTMLDESTSPVLMRLLSFPEAGMLNKENKNSKNKRKREKKEVLRVPGQKIEN